MHLRTDLIDRLVCTLHAQKRASQRAVRDAALHLTLTWGRVSWLHNGAISVFLGRRQIEAALRRGAPSSLKALEGTQLIVSTNTGDIITTWRARRPVRAGR